MACTLLANVFRTTLRGQRIPLDIHASCNHRRIRSCVKAQIWSRKHTDPLWTFLAVARLGRHTKRRVARTRGWINWRWPYCDFRRMCTFSTGSPLILVNVAMSRGMRMTHRDPSAVCCGARRKAVDMSVDMKTSFSHRGAIPKWSMIELCRGVLLAVQLPDCVVDCERPSNTSLDFSFSTCRSPLVSPENLGYRSMCARHKFCLSSLVSDVMTVSQYFVLFHCSEFCSV